MLSKQVIYGDICKVLTDYENEGNEGHEQEVTKEDFYCLLVKVQNYFDNE